MRAARLFSRPVIREANPAVADSFRTKDAITARVGMPAAIAVLRFWSISRSSYMVQRSDLTIIGAASNL